MIVITTKSVLQGWSQSQEKSLLTPDLSLLPLTDKNKKLRINFDRLNDVKTVQIYELSAL